MFEKPKQQTPLQSPATATSVLKPLTSLRVPESPSAEDLKANAQNARVDALVADYRLRNSISA
jgi:hypothetical protein